MHIEQSGSSELTITGNIKSIQDSTSIKNALNTMVKAGSKRVLLRVKLSFSMTSAVIGYLMKLVNQDKVQVSIVIEDQRLYTLLDSLNLIQAFQVTMAADASVA